MTARVNTAIVREWVDALRSGLYEQTRGRLTRVNPITNQVTHCCLGVLCDLAVKHGVAEKSESTYLYETSLRYNMIGLNYKDEGMPPPGINKWVGLDYWWVEDGSLTELNDSKGWTFDDIADALEKEYL